jgi:hypothetical protein
LRRPSKRAQLEPIMAALASRARNGTGMQLKPEQRRHPGSERAWKWFTEGDVAFRLRSDLMKRLDEYASRVSTNAPGYRLSASEIAQLILSWVLCHVQREPAGDAAHDLAATLRREASRLDYHLDAICIGLDEIERFDPKTLCQELAGLEQLYGDLDVLADIAVPKLPSP